MAMIQMPAKGGNSDNQRKASERPKVKHIEGAGVVKKETTFWQRLKGEFVPENPKKAIEDIVITSIVPSLKNTMLNMINTTSSMLIWGDTSHTIVNKNSNGFSTNYQAISSGNNVGRNTLNARTGHVDVFEYTNIGFKSKNDAEEAIMILQEQIAQFGHVDVAVLYEIVDQQFNPIDTRYGWYNLMGVDSYLGRDGYWYIDLPRATQLR